MRLTMLNAGRQLQPDKVTNDKEGARGGCLGLSSAALAIGTQSASPRISIVTMDTI